MIQRIQTLWLLMASAAALLLFIVPSYIAIDGNTSYTIYAYGVKTVNSSTISTSNNNLLLLSTLMAGLISLLNIFNYKKRAFQKRIAILNIILLAMLSFWLYKMGASLPPENARQSLGMFLPLAAIIFTFLAIRGIQFDDKLIRSADRLR